MPVKHYKSLETHSKLLELFIDFPVFETCGPSSSFSCASLKPCNFDTWQILTQDLERLRQVSLVFQLLPYDRRFNVCIALFSTTFQYCHGNRDVQFAIGWCFFFNFTFASSMYFQKWNMVPLLGHKLQVNALF